MKTVVFDGPELDLTMKHERYGLFVFPQGVPVDVQDDFAEELLSLNPRHLPVERAAGYDGPLAIDYGMKVFRVVEASSPAFGASRSYSVDGGSR
jgi:hypothetical protein